MEGRVTKLDESFVIKAAELTIGKDKVGAGNFADVFKGVLRHNKCERQVAIKIVRIGGGNRDEEMHCVSEMSNEALIMSLHTHKGIIEFYGVSMDKLPMIIMEYCVGGSLDLHLREFKEHIRTAERIRYLYEITSGMRYLERKQCVHRDLATRNVLIAEDGFLRVCDFGLSRCPTVAPPKQSGPSHIFSCGQKPWPEKPVKWIATKIRKGVTPEMPKRMPRLVRELVTSCFQRDPAQRPSFKQLNGRVLFVQSLRFPTPDPKLLTVGKIKDVTNGNEVDYLTTRGGSTTERTKAISVKELTYVTPPPSQQMEESDQEASCVELEERMDERSVVINYTTRSSLMGTVSVEHRVPDKSREDWKEIPEVSDMVSSNIRSITDGDKMGDAQSSSSKKEEPKKDG